MKKLSHKRILVIDDDAGMLRALEKVLTGEGAEVTSAAWAGDGIEMLTERQQHMDLVITDLRMPILSGITVVYAIHKVFPYLPVIVLTAFGSPELQAECLRLGAAAFLEKPLDTRQLLQALQRVLASQEIGA
jgi:two-component system NtrC family response regulator